MSSQTKLFTLPEPGPHGAHTLDDLVEAGLVPSVTPELEKVADQFAISITPAMMDVIDRSDPNDPIAAQFVPTVDELQAHPSDRDDPIGDRAFSPVEGIVHRYPDRLLLKLLHACPVYCRFCFRREQVGPDHGLLSAEALDTALAYIEAHPDVWEVILSGGEPLMLSPRRLADVMQRLFAIPHVKVLRIHTRMPVVDPDRITPALVQALKGPKPVYILLHTNHARELTDAARAACARLVEAGFPMLSQSVLLRGVNDTPDSLAALMRALVESRVKPHHLHHADLAPGTAHFRVPLAEGQALVKMLRGRMSGLCQPGFILDIPGGHGKVPVGPVHVTADGDGWIVEDYRGTKHAYGG